MCAGASHDRDMCTGFASSLLNSSSCDTCQKGFFAGKNGSVECDSCHPGTDSSSHAHDTSSTLVVVINATTT